MRDTFERRRREGRVRDVHGDLHLGNVTQFEGRTLLFGCLEFSAELRQVDPFDELAYLGLECAVAGASWVAQREPNRRRQQQCRHGE